MRPQYNTTCLRRAYNEMIECRRQTMIKKNHFENDFKPYPRIQSGTGRECHDFLALLPCFHGRVLTKLLKRAKVKFQFSHFQLFCDNFNSFPLHNNNCTDMY